MAEHAARLLVVFATLLSADLPAAEVFYDYADVTAVQPVVEQTSAAGIVRPCRRSALSEPGWETRPHYGNDIQSLVAALRFETDRRSGAGRCDPDGGQRVTANRYRVTYRYGGVEYVRVMERDPGGRVQVKVRVDPEL